MPSIPQFEALGSAARAIAAVALLLAAALPLGRLLVPPASSRSWRAIDAFLLRLAVGLNLVGAIGVALGTARLLPGSRSIWLLAGLALLNLLFIRLGATPALAWACAVLKWRSPLAWLALPLLLVTLGPALAYPTGWDELVYHSVLPQRWLADGWPAFYADLPYSGFPSLGEILFWLVAPIESVITPRFLIWICWILGLALLYRLLTRRLRASSAAAMTLAFALSEAILMVSATCYVESIQLLNVAALLLVLEGKGSGVDCGTKPSMLADNFRNRFPTPLVLGVLAGGAAAVKLTGLAVLVVPCLWYLGQLWRRRSPARMLAASLAVYLLVALAVTLPFYLRPWIATGNPLYPYYAQWFSSDPARLEMSRYHHALGAAFGVPSPVAVPVGILFLAFERPLYDGAFGWQLLIFVALAGFAVASAPRARRRPFILWPAASFGWLYLFWHLTAQQARFAIPAILSLLLLAAMGLRRMHGRHRQLALAVLLAAAAISVPWRTTGHYFGSWLSALGIISRTAYVNESTDRVYLPLVKAISDHTPADAKLMVLFEHRGFYLPRKYEVGTPFFQEASFTPPERFDAAERLMDVLTRQQITHVVITNAPAGPDQVQGWFDRLETFLPCFGQAERQGRLRVVWHSERYVLLEVL